MAITVNVYEAKTRLSSLLTRVEGGEDVVIARNGRPIALMTSVAHRRPDRTPGTMRDLITIGAGFDQFTAADDVDWYGGGPA